VLFIFLQVTQWSCKVCGEDVFTSIRKTVVSRHVMEQHSGFGYRCQGCNKIFGRQDQKHQGCQFPAAGDQCNLVNRITGDTDEVAKRQYNSFSKTVNFKMGSKLVPRAFTLPSQKAVGVKRSQGGPAVPSKRQRLRDW